MTSLILTPKQAIPYFHNRGCGMCYLQRNRKEPLTAIPADSWFLREGLSDKLSLDIPWCLLEPEEGKFDWEGPQWEGCFRSWMDAGFKIVLKVRSMATLGTLYNDGVPQWVFDAGAKYVDDPISIYRRDVTQLDDDIPATGRIPVRYPVYWDPVYMEKAEAMIHALGKRYNGNPAIESVGIGQMGRWGELHLGDWGPMEPWLDAGFSIGKYIETGIRFIDIYRSAFPDTALSMEIHRAALYSNYKWPMLMPLFEYAAEHKVMLKYDGLGMSFEPGSTPYLCKSVADIYDRFRYKTKLQFENLVLPEALDNALACGISYWQRGGESGAGEGIGRIEQPGGIHGKKLFSWYYSFRDRYEALTVEEQKDCFRKMALKCGYRLTLDAVHLPETLSAGRGFEPVFIWRNLGYAPCYEPMHAELALFDPNARQYVWQQNSVLSEGDPQLWDCGKTVEKTIRYDLPSGVKSGKYELHLTVRLDLFHNEKMQLALTREYGNRTYVLGEVQVK